MPAPTPYMLPSLATNGAETPAYRHREVAGPGKQLFMPSPPVQTLYENFQNGVKHHADSACLGTRAVVQRGQTKIAGPYVWQTYAQVNERLTAFGSGVLALHQENVKAHSGAGWHLGLYSVNRAEWVVAEQAANAYNLVTVALYDTLGADTLEFTINHAELSVLVCSADKISNILKVAGKCPVLKVIVSMDALDPAAQTTKILRDWCADKKIKLFSFADVEKMGREKPLKHRPPKPEDVATICYTSGTTGNPKGAMLMHKNFVASALSFRAHKVSIDHSDVMISYLPLAHCFERVMEVAMYNVGGRVGFFRGDVLLLVEDIAELKPTIFPTVPRLFNRIYGKLVEGTVNAPGVRGMLFRRAVADKMASIKAGQGVHHALWDRLLFSKVAAVLGGRCRVMITGSAPISGDVLTFLRICFSCDILEGYGQTECAAGSTITFPGDHKPGQVGAALTCNEIKLVDVPDMGYLHTDKPPRGEVCIRGHNVMKGYYKDEEKTRETIDADGWLHTGDIGIITAEGTLALIDRKKNIFKLAQGEYVAPEKLEAIYAKAEMLMQCFVHGDSLQSELIAVIVPDPEKFPGWLKAQFGAVALAEAARDPKVHQAILNELARVGKKYGLAGFEMIKAIHVELEPFSVENDLLTPSFKLKRNIAQKKYRAVLDQLYQHLNKGKANL